MQNRATIIEIINEYGEKVLIIISNDQKFIKFYSNAAEGIGYICITSNYENAIDIAIKCNPDIALVHSDNTSESSAKECVSGLALRKPETKILTAVEKYEGSPSLYLDIEGSHRQINLPCSTDDLQNALTRLSDPNISVKQLYIGKGRKDIILLSERLPLSKIDYAILRLTAKAYPRALNLDHLLALFPRITENSLRVHINTINKAAERITERRLIVFKNGYRLNEFM